MKLVMVRKQEIEQRIPEQCLGGDSILTVLRDRKFDREKYLTLLNDLIEYRKLIAGEDSINRRIAGYLHTIEGVFANESRPWKTRGEMSDVEQQVTDAYVAIWEVMNDIFSINENL